MGALRRAVAVVGSVGCVLAGVLVAAAPPALAAGTTISTRTTGLGLIAVGKDRHTVYLFTKDGRNTSRCGPTCRQTWHRVKTDGPPRAGAGIKKSHLGQTPHHQVTYYGHPLYYYAGDAKAGQTRGQSLRSFGGRWWVVSPQGKAGTGATIALHSTPDGPAVAGAHGHTLYLLTTDSRTTTTCTSACAGTWPPLVTTGKPRAGSGTSAGLLSTLVRPNGTRQVVYNRHPLYYYAGDSAAGQDYGQCLPQNPGTWYIVNGAGNAVTAGCGSSAVTCGGAPASTPASATITTRSKGTLGTLLTDARGCTVYEFDPDTAGGIPTCAGACASTWPPVLTTGPPTQTASCATLDTVANGSAQQVRCNGHPLYFYAPDANDAKACGQGSGSVWWTLDTTGAKKAGAAVC